MTKFSSGDIERIVDLVTERVEEALRGSPSANAAERSSCCGGCKVAGKCDSRGVIESIDRGAGRISAVGRVEDAPCSFVAPMIDHTILKPEATKDELRQVCDEAKRFGFATVCVNSANVRFVASCLEGSDVKPIAVVGFPLGAATPGAKAFETREAIRNGAKEIDMVINIGALKSRELAFVFEDIRSVVQAAGNIPVKVILETSKLDHDEKVMGSTLAAAAGAAFVKTSTGFGGGGATPEDVALMRATVGEDIGVKASGGIRTIEDVEAVIRAGASRIGASSSVAIVKCDRTKPQAKTKVRSAY